MASFDGQIDLFECLENALEEAKDGLGLDMVDLESGLKSLSQL
jgi:hypothetical protein